MGNPVRSPCGIHPGLDDHLARSVIAKEQPVLLQEFGTKPVLAVFPEGVALSVLGPSRILRNDFERQLADCSQALGRIVSAAWSAPTVDSGQVIA